MKEYDYIKDKRGRKLIVITTGGTAGHIFPAEVMAHKLNQITEAQEFGEIKGEHKYDILFVGDRRVGNFAEFLPNIKRLNISARGYSHVGGLRGYLENGRAILYLFFGFLTVLGHFIIRRPSAVIGFGSYASIPALLAAFVLRVPYMLHEQNAVLGRANRLFLKGAKRLALSFSDTEHAEIEAIEAVKVVDIDDEYEEVEDIPEKIRHSGNPVRSGFVAYDYESPLADGEFHILITGGSQGAKIFGDILPQALSLLPSKVKKRLRIVQQIRGEQILQVKKLYADEGIDVALSPFLSNMPELLKGCHLFIGRAGASTVAELMAMGRPSLLIPLANSVDGHQQANANFLKEQNGAWVLEQKKLTVKILSSKLREIIEKPDVLNEVALGAANSYSGNAEEVLKNILMEFLEGEIK